MSCEPKVKGDRADEWAAGAKAGLKMSASAGKAERPARAASLNEEAESLITRPETASTCASPAAVKELLRSRSAKQVSWMLLLQVHKAAGFVAGMGSGAWSMLKQVGSRLSSDKVREGEEGRGRSTTRGIRMSRGLHMAG